jgi:hypothetical protein
MNNNKGFWFKKIIGITFCVLAVGALLSWVVMQLWNHVLVTAVTGIHIINFWEALGLLILSKILFGGFRKGWGGGRHKWNNEMKEKWQHMTPEEREKFKQEWRNKCGMWGRSRFSQTASQAGSE